MNRPLWPYLHHMSDDDSKVVELRPGKKTKARKKLGPGDPNYRPASGIPAGGMGWGGPAKGSDPNRTPSKTLAEVHPVQSDTTPKSGMYANKKARAEKMEAVLETIALDEREGAMVRVQAASKLHAILEGAPVARNINTNVDDLSNLTDEELERELERVRRTGA